jgi:anti-sigma factor ChrR (cupin superfamily)
MAEDGSRLIEYVLGVLDDEARAEMERELATSSRTERKRLELEEALASLALAAEPRQPGEGLRNRLLASLDPDTRFEGFVERLAVFLDLGADRVRRLLATVPEAPGGSWQASGLPGIHLLPFAGGPRIATAECLLIQLEPGRIFPSHRHRGDEWGFVLQGSAEEDGGRRFEPGDIVHKAPGSAHSFQALGTEPFVFAVVLHLGIDWLTG